MSRSLIFKRRATALSFAPRRHEYSTQRLIVTAGPWAGRWLGDLGVRLVVRRKPLFWFGTKSGDVSCRIGLPGVSV